MIHMEHRQNRKPNDTVTPLVLYDPCQEKLQCYLLVPTPKNALALAKYKFYTRKTMRAVVSLRQ